MEKINLGYVKSVEIIGADFKNPYIVNANTKYNFDIEDDIFYIAVLYVDGDVEDPERVQIKIEEVVDKKEKSFSKYVMEQAAEAESATCLLYTSPSPRD